MEWPQTAEPGAHRLDCLSATRMSSRLEPVEHAVAERKRKLPRINVPGAHMEAFCADLRRAYEVESGSRLARIAGCLRAPGVHAVAVFRFGQWTKSKGRFARLLLDPVYVLLQLAIQVVWGIDLPRGAKVGPGLYIGHFGGMTISRNAVIGRDCNLSQGITIGFSGGPGGGCPRIGDRVYIAPGARVFGKITIGSNVKIGANAVVHRDIPDNAIVVLDPGFRILSLKGNRP
jgi:serine O-acetyltransferase